MSDGLAPRTAERSVSGAVDSKRGGVVVTVPGEGGRESVTSSSPECTGDWFGWLSFSDEEDSGTTESPFYSRL